MLSHDGRHIHLDGTLLAVLDFESVVSEPVNYAVVAVAATSTLAWARLRSLLLLDRLTLALSLWHRILLLYISMLAVG